MEERILTENTEEKISVTAEEVTDIRLTQAGYYWDAGYNEFDFICKIEGVEDKIHMVQQRHDEGYGLVIRSEKDDIWDRISGSEAFRLEEKLLDEVQYRSYHDRIEKLTSLSNCREMYYELMENDNHNLRNVIGNLWMELREKEDQLAVSVISDFRKKTMEQFHSVEGTVREDDFFNIVHEDDFKIAGIAVDINPITEDKTGLLAEYLESAEQYLKEKAQERKLEKPSVREKIKQAKQITQEKKKVNIEKSKKLKDSRFISDGGWCMRVY